VTRVFYQKKLSFDKSWRLFFIIGKPTESVTIIFLSFFGINDKNTLTRKLNFDIMVETFPFTKRNLRNLSSKQALNHSFYSLILDKQQWYRQK